MSNRKWGILLLGGSQTHLEDYSRGFEADPRCRLIGLADENEITPRRRTLNDKLATELNVPYFESLSEALNRDDVDMVINCLEPERRARVSIKCAQAGKHLYIDKPLATSIEDAKEMLEVIREAKVKSQIFSLVRSSLGRRAKEVVESGVLGKLTGLHCELLFAKGNSGTADLSQIRTEKKDPTQFTFIDSKRELFCVGLYPLVLFQWLTGDRFVNVTGTTSNYFFSEHQKNDVEDFSCLMMEMSSGIESTIMVGRTGWNSHPSHGIHQIHLTGTKGSQIIDAYQPRMQVFSNSPTWSAPAVPHPDDPMGFWSSTNKENGVLPKEDWFPVEEETQSDMSYFIDCLENDRESDVPASVGAHAVEVILKGYESAAEDKTVSL
jgi:myo-inositol 2-dehydrogenase / D-chiro-inositol 1-dehydrogenase